MDSFLDTLLKEDYVQIEANPQYYDYLHAIRLTASKKIFELLNGGGQYLSERYWGYFEFKEDELILYFENQVDELCELKVDKQNILKCKIIEENRRHFDGYCMKESKYTIIFDKSPFQIKYWKCKTDNYPLTFYSGISFVDCNIRLERIKSSRNDFFDKIKYKGVETDDYFLKIKKEYEEYNDKNNLSDDVMKSILDLKDKLLDGARCPIKFISWLYNKENSVVFYQSDMDELFEFSEGQIKSWYYGYIKKNENRERITIYSLPEDYELIKEKLLVYNASNTNDKLYFENLCKFKKEVLRIV